MTTISKNVNVDRLDNAVDKYNNTHHRTIKMKPIDVKSSKYIAFDVQNNVKDPNFEVGDQVTISKYKNILIKSLHSKLVRRSFCYQKVKKKLCFRLL